METEEHAYMQFNSARVIHEMKKGLNDKKKWQHGDEMFPTRTLDVKTPSTPNDRASLSIEHNKQMMEGLQKSLDDCIRECNRALEALGDRASDIFDVTLYLWTKKAEVNSDFVVITASEIAELLGFSKRKAGGYRTRDKENIAKIVDLLKLIQLDADMTIEFFNKNNKKEKKNWALKSSALLIAAALKETNLTEDDKVIQAEFKWTYKPGAVLAPFLDAPNKRFAFIDRKIIQMCPHKEKYEKRLGKAGAWFFKVNLKNRGGLARLKVSSLLKDAIIEIDYNHPGKTVDIFEKARFSLLEKEIFRVFEYENPKEVSDIIAKRDRGWLEKWLESVVILEPPTDLLDRYIPKKEELLDAVALKRFRNLGEEISEEEKDVIDVAANENFETREKPGAKVEASHSLLAYLNATNTTLTQLAKELGCSQPYISMITKGKKNPSKKMRLKINAFLAGKTLSSATKPQPNP